MSLLLTYKVRIGSVLHIFVIKDKVIKDHMSIRQSRTNVFPNEN